MISRETMPDIREAFIGPYFDAMWLPEGTLLPVIICKISPKNTERDTQRSREHPNGKLIDKEMIWFAGEHRRLIANKTNLARIGAMFSEHQSAWFGKTINLQRFYLPDCGAACSQNDLGIRVAVPPGTRMSRKYRRTTGQPWPYDSQQPANLPVTVLPVKPPTIVDSILTTLPDHEKEAYFIAWGEYIRIRSPEALPKLMDKVRVMLTGPAVERLGQILRSEKTPAKPERPPQETPPASAPEPDTTQLQEWLTGIRPLDTLEACREFREQILPDCPDAIRAQVEEALAEREKTLAKNSS